ncbi:helix-turn-helix domain-containing protein [Rossellomorea aquimaris]|uniref:helix-turn-helix transcriptional regulator n=1 Tax=Rossellomorea aquimaris TaxID=189382 RepID=UPI001CD5CC42|nr:helix-turn-helix transcriptional regulator [Rossellomorea aquimaris]MCA1059764.1 helix-turn-helix domain-containing protein [Rossellomorea aquimaris]
MEASTFKGLRLRASKTQVQWAEFLGVSESTVAAIENGRRRVSDTVRARLAQKVSIDDDLMSFFDSLEKFKQLYS